MGPLGEKLVSAMLRALAGLVEPPCDRLEVFRLLVEAGRAIQPPCFMVSCSYGQTIRRKNRWTPLTAFPNS